MNVRFRRPAQKKAFVQVLKEGHMNGMIIRTLVTVLCLLGSSTGCMTSSPNSDMSLDTPAPTVEEVGLEDGRTNYDWMTYKSVVPFASQTSKSTAISGGRDGTPVFAKASRKSKTKQVAKAP